ncbi:hypothetical protein A2707_05450 [Candidatus Saccharibacteria bacterium RIFCSPHIGHO2_01_FULL_45_15]|nr:MAG: hypothetical protein A2707_05450 [Candidatus Saccharibacteria bacterium RIFCSPHIGHO2_01_FULL_45_15]OGL28892.1 MAG: hypothetical protein A3C39_05660 [Candidatus Saccharibacteria bacterium RIFCSPHIGHO2_02_FULL_46_12]OGL31903.1 MAG: hypothetical protein A3E76_01390 [Candidatus Saccharibacteria bacterium RIFCSPHIGHO2_12_FULL_44_22]
MDKVFELLSSVADLLPTVGLWLLVIAGVVVLVAVGVRVWDFMYALKSPHTFFELIPPVQAAKRPRATQEFFAVLHGLHTSRTLSDRLLRRHPHLSLEVTSTKQGGIRYIARVPDDVVETFHQTITSYLPDMIVKETSDYFAPQLSGQTIEFRQTGHFAFPLNMQEELEEHDPIAYLTGSMTKLEANEQVAFQIVLTPTRAKEAEIIARKILTNEDLLGKLEGRHTPGISGIFTAINSSMFSIMDGIGSGLSGSSSTYRRDSFDTQLTQHKQQAALGLKPARILSSFEQELVESIHHKVNQPIFQVVIRVYVASPNKQKRSQRIKGIRASLASFNVPKYQSLQARYSFPRQLINRYRTFALRHRLPSFLHSKTALLATSELSDLYHFPYAGTTKTENIVKSLSRTLPAPLSLKKDSDFDVVLGVNRYHGEATLIGLTEKERERHVYIIGGTGNGKTTMLQYALVQDICSGKGVAVIDPHGDMAETLLRYVPEERVKDVVYFNPDDLTYPIGLNLLELDHGLEGDELLREKDLITETVVSIFRKIFSEDDSGGHRIEYMLRNAVQTALTQENATLFTVYDLINDPACRKKVIPTLEDENLKHFWRNEFGKAGGMQQVKMAAGITAKIGRFLFSASAKRILEQEKSTIDFDDIINNRKILICNFSKGLLGEDTSELFGIMVLAKLQLASLRRARVQQSERTPYHLYVDEFQNFATMSFVQMLSESRKYKLFLTMAEQSTSQQDDQRMVNIILANVGTVICFRTGNPADEQSLLQMFAPYIEQGEIANLPAFNYYVRIAAVLSQEPLSGETLLLDDNSTQGTAARQAIINNSRKAYAIKYAPKAPKPARAKVATPKRTTQKKETPPSTSHRKLPGEE